MPSDLTPWPPSLRGKRENSGKGGGGVNPPRGGPKTPANPKPTRAGKRGVEGACAPSQGVWGMCPQNKKRGGELPTLATSPRVGPNTLANPQSTGVGQWGSRGRSPLARGCGGVPHEDLKKGRGANPCKPATRGTKNAGKLKAHEGGQTGGGGDLRPLPGGLGDVPPTKSKHKKEENHGRTASESSL